MPDELEQVEQSLYFEILKSEQKRVKLLLGFFSIAFVVWLLIRLFLAENLNKIVGGYFPTGYFLALISFGILYESAFLRVLIHFYNKRKHFHEMGRAGNTLIETIYPTAILYILCHTLNPLVALHSPVVLLYFLLIILSIFRLNLYLALFTGFSAATQFFLMNLFFLPDHPAP